MASYQNKVNQKSTFRPTALRLMDQVRKVLRYHHYGKRTEEAYVRWIKGFIYFHNKASFEFRVGSVRSMTLEVKHYEQSTV